jgi:hypothetical protein
MRVIVRPAVRRSGVARARPRLAGLLLAIACAGALTGALACRDATGPRVTRSYTLRRFDGRTLPTPIYTSASDTAIMLGETLALREDGTAVQATRMYTTAGVSGGEPAGTRVGTATATYRLIGTRLELTFDCPPNANCIGGPVVGTIRSDELTLGDAGRSSNTRYYVAADVTGDATAGTR